MYRIGIDVGGTFTDVAAVDSDGHVTIAKSASTPADPSEGLVDGLEALAQTLGLDLATLLARTERIVHGTTVATNALLERKGATVGLLTTAGHRDVIEMREGLKDDRYNLRMPPPIPLVPRARRLGVRERVRFDGRVSTPLDRRSLARALATLKATGVESVAICYLHSYANPAHERATGREVARTLPRAYRSLSVDVLPQIKEYERVWTTVVNAYVGPALARYLAHLGAKLRARGYRGDVLVMQSHGGVAPIAESRRLAAGAVLSGPAGGVAAGRYCVKLLNTKDLITFDMGGTSTDIALLQDGEPTLSGEKTVGIAKVALPSLDIHTLGAGGGSIARVDGGGILHVGPESAGAQPGPACYGRGGVGPTVTDADLILGFLDPANFFGGRIALDSAAAARAVDTIATALGVDRLTAAEGIYRVVNTNMAEGIKLVSVRRGVDPRRFTLVAFGGAAGLHITQVARQLEIRRVVVPTVASVLSAWGMLATDLRYELVRSHVSELSRLKPAALRQLFGTLEREGRTRLGRFDGPVRVRRGLDMRYGEQIFEIAVDLDGVELGEADLLDQIATRFHKRHDELYAYSAPGQEVVVVNARVAVVGELEFTLEPNRAPDGRGVAPPGFVGSELRPLPTADVGATPPPSGARFGSSANSRRRIYLSEWVDVPVYMLDALTPGEIIRGPALFESATTTVLVREGEAVSVTSHGWLDIALG
ncbi:MAG TPA: hydantoinase/oxoprolinase family protein [Methylomirabilota bacterium]|nr:hydantoinase/oxoprolinase family protein [Methylomirabilota bacterium]